MTSYSQIPDPEEDFEGCVSALAEQALREIMSVPEKLRPTYLVMRAAARLHRFVSLDAPEFITENEKQHLLNAVNRLPVYYAEWETLHKEAGDDEEGTD